MITLTQVLLLIKEGKLADNICPDCKNWKDASSASEICVRNTYSKTDKTYANYCEAFFEYCTKNVITNVEEDVK